MKILHLQMFSGGACSWMSAKRMVAKHGKDGCAMLFVDVKGDSANPHDGEDEDTYRFIKDASANVGVPLFTVSKGVSVWQHFFNRRMMGNSRMPICSVELKREILDRWQAENCDPANTVLYYGIDWTEQHRCEPLRKMRSPFRVEFPMCGAPYLSKSQMLDAIKAEGLIPPRMYCQGFPHNNCGGFCVKAGQAHFAHLLRVNPERFAYHEAREQEFIKMIGKDVSIMKDRTGGTTKTLTLKQLRERIERHMEFDAFEWGGCGCSVDL